MNQLTTNKVNTTEKINGIYINTCQIMCLTVHDFAFSFHITKNNKFYIGRTHSKQYNNKIITFFESLNEKDFYEIIAFIKGDSSYNECYERLMSFNY
jgi:hypothetical protein